VVMSHWAVNDESTSIFMDLFYGYLAKGMTKDRALQLAKVDFLENASAYLTNPFYWGGFVVMGDARPVNLGGSFNLWIYLVSGMLLLVIIVWYIHKRK